MIEIPEPPNPRACARCSSPLSWLYSPRTQSWVAFVPSPEDNRTLHVHDCVNREQTAQPWRSPYSPITDAEAERVRRGVALARAALAEPVEAQPEAVDR